MTYDTIEDEESTPLHDGGYSANSTTAAALSTKKPTSSTIVRAMMVGATVGVLLLMAGPSMMTMNTRSRNVDGMVVVSSATSRLSDEQCAPATGTFSGLSCQGSDGWCAGAGESFREYPAMLYFETCYVSQNGYCWSHSHEVDGNLGTLFIDYYTRCDPDGYIDGRYDYKSYGIWHISAPLSDGSCGNPCQEFKSA